MIVFPHTPYYPDLVLADIFYFQKLKFPLKGQKFSTINEIKKNVLTELRVTIETAFNSGIVVCES